MAPYRMKRYLLLLVVVLAAGLGPGASTADAQEEPPLPPGLGAVEPRAEGEPALPPGLAQEQKPAAKEPELPPGLAPREEVPPTEPTLPEGLVEEKAAPPGPVEAEKEPLRLPIDLTGFWEARGGVRTQRDLLERDASIGETRLQLEAEKAWVGWGLQVTADFLFDPVFDKHEVRLEEGQGWLDLRQANVFVTPAEFMDVKVGRQVLTWGTGDLLFLNDLFPKDWVSFFAGRDDEYLKAPSNSMRVTHEV